MTQNKVKPWILVALCCGLMAGSVGISLNTSGVFYTPVSNDLHILRGSFAMHMTLFTLVTGFGAFFVPTMLKKIRFKLLLVISVSICALATIAMGWFSSLPIFYLLGIIRGFSAAMFSVLPLSMIINNWFKKSHGLALSIVFSASGLAGAIGSYVFGLVISQYGWRVGYLVSGIAIAVLAIPAIVYPFELKPEDEGKLPYGATKEIEKVVEIEENVQESHFNFLNISLICLALMGILASFTSSIAQHFPGYAETINFAATGSLMVSAGMIGNIVFKVVIGLLSDKMGPIKAALVTMTLTILGLLIVLIGRNQILLISGAFIFGAVYSIGAVASSLLVIEFFGLKHYNTVYPVINFVNNAGAAVSLSAIGFIYDLFNSYQIAILICVSFIVIAIIALLIGKNTSQQSY